MTPQTAVAHRGGEAQESAVKRSLTEELPTLAVGRPQVTLFLFVPHMELQADCFAGIWAHSPEEREILEHGDDRVQRMSGGQVSPESFTHGSSAQRVHWFQQGMASGPQKTAIPSRTS